MSRGASAGAEVGGADGFVLDGMDLGLLVRVCGARGWICAQWLQRRARERDRAVAGGLGGDAGASAGRSARGGRAERAQEGQRYGIRSASWKARRFSPVRRD
jgi:hypothetical protein